MVHFCCFIWILYALSRDILSTKNLVTLRRNIGPIWRQSCYFLTVHATLVVIAIRCYQHFRLHICPVKWNNGIWTAKKNIHFLEIVLLLGYFLCQCHYAGVIATPKATNAHFVGIRTAKHTNLQKVLFGPIPRYVIRLRKLYKWFHYHLPLNQ